jgi:hypothetical protein
VPAGSVDETFARWEGSAIPHRAVYDAIMRHVASLGDDVHLDAVSVGVFLKRTRKLAEIRPKARSLNLSLYMERAIEDARVSQHYRIAAGRWVSVVKLVRVADVDDAVRGWVTEAFVGAGEG